MTYECECFDLGPPPVSPSIMGMALTCHCLALGTQVRNKAVAKKPRSVTSLDGDQVHSTHTGDLDTPLLPAAARYCHIIPGLAKHLLISVVKLCKAGCDVRFNKFGIGVEVRYRQRSVLTGSKFTRTGLWMVPLKASPNTTPAPCARTYASVPTFSSSFSKIKQ